jgi:hypothetical protein
MNKIRELTEMEVEVEGGIGSRRQYQTSTSYRSAHRSTPRAAAVASALPLRTIGGTETTSVSSGAECPVPTQMQ